MSQPIALLSIRTYWQNSRCWRYDKFSSSKSGHPESLIRLWNAQLKFSWNASEIPYISSLDIYRCASFIEVTMVLKTMYLFHSLSVRFWIQGLLRIKSHKIRSNLSLGVKPWSSRMESVCTELHLKKKRNNRSHLVPELRYH